MSDTKRDIAPLPPPDPPSRLAALLAARGKQQAAQHADDLSRFCQLSGAGGPGLLLDAADAAAVAAAAGSLVTPLEELSEAQSLAVCFYDAHGCALVASRELGTAAEAMVRLRVVGLDGWEFAVTGSGHPNKRQWKHEATAGPGSTVDCEPYPARRHKDFLHFLHAIFERDSKKTGDKRSAAGGSERGHQKTPSWLASVASDAAELACQHYWPGGDEEEQKRLLHSLEARQPRGAFTDVGLHTGGEARNTGWPLAASTLQQLLQQPHEGAGDTVASPQAGPRLVAAYELAWLERCCGEALSSSEATPVARTAVMKQLEHCCWLAEQLAKTGAAGEGAMLDYSARCSALRAALEAAVRERAEAAAAAYELTLTADEERAAFVLPRVPLPAAETDLTATSTASLQQLQDQGFQAAGPRPLLAARTLPSSLLQWLQEGSKQPQTAEELLLQLRTVEEQLWDIATRVLAAPEPDVQAYLQLSEVTALVKCVDVHYKRCYDSLLKMEERKHLRLGVEQKSRRLLVLWTAYCLCHKAAAAERELVREFAVALQHEQLSHAVLSDAAARKALLAVDAYLRRGTSGLKRRHTRGRKLVLFSTHPEEEESSREFAQEFAAGDKKLQRLLMQAEEIADERKREHWAEVQQQQSALNVAREKEHRCKVAVDQLKQNREPHFGYDKELQRAECASAEAVRSRDRLEKSPPALLQDLPRDKQEAGRVLFFLYMPPLLCHLAHMSVTAQAWLMPQSVLRVSAAPKDDWALRVKEMPELHKSSLHLHYRRPKDEFKGPPCVDELHNADDGVFYPDEFMSDSRCHWHGRAGKDPFLVECTDADLHKATRDSFTEQLPKPQNGKPHELQWIMPLYSKEHISKTRGNEQLAQQTLRPDYVKPEAYKLLCTLRAFPSSQFQQLSRALQRSSLLPLDQPLVALLLRQLLFHVGKVDRQSRLAWHTVWQEGETGKKLLGVFRAELKRLVGELSQSPARFKEVPIVSDLLAFFCEYDSSMLPWRALLARGLLKEANLVLERIEASERGDGAAVRELRARAAIFFQSALLCFRLGSLQPSDLKLMLQCYTQSYQLQPLNVGHVSETERRLEDNVLQLRTLCFQLMAERCAGVLSQLMAGDDKIITEAVAPVIGMCVEEQQWLLPDTECAVLQATADDSVFHVNVLTGAVFINGKPPHRLPSYICAHENYVRVFGKRNFNVRDLPSGLAFRTVRPIEGSLYEFRVGGRGSELTCVGN